MNVEISADAKVEIRGWLGAVLRNNLLYAASRVSVSEEQTLLDWIDGFPLPENHPMYKELRGGFPKSYALFLRHPERMAVFPLVLEEGDVVAFSLVLIGKAAGRCREFIEALRLMCRRGIGSPLTSFSLLGISEEDSSGENHPMDPDELAATGTLKYPVSLESFDRPDSTYVAAKLRLTFDSPVLLADPVKKKNRTASYQDKMNAFPSLYQFVRSAYYRLMKLAVLYGDVPERSEEHVAFPDENELEAYLVDAASALLLEASLHWVRMPGPLRKEGRRPMCFTGYVGDVAFVGDFSRYMPLLAFIQVLGIGNDTVYGLGNSHFEVLKYINKE